MVRSIGNHLGSVGLWRRSHFTATLSIDPRSFVDFIQFIGFTLQVRGIFVGAKVVRGSDWDWGNQVWQTLRTDFFIKKNLFV